MRTMQTPTRVHVFTRKTRTTRTSALQKGRIPRSTYRFAAVSVRADNMNFFSALVFGVIFSVGWTPCVGAFLGSALALASQQGHALQGMLLLFVYSLGLGVPFVISAVLIDRLKTAFDWIKRHYQIINAICGGFLIVVGVLMATGLLGRFLNLLS